MLFVSQGKGQKDRYVPIGLRALLWIARYVDGARDHLAIDPQERTLFLTNDGKPINPDSLTEYGRRYIKAAAVRKPGACHIFRHTMATLMHDAGADIRTLQEILGHAKLDTTQIYTLVSASRSSWKLIKRRIQPNGPNRQRLSRILMNVDEASHYQTSLRPWPASKMAAMVALLQTSETNSQNTLHARGPLRNRSALASVHSKPRQFAVSCESIEPRDAQLGSCSRDPIEYQAGDPSFYRMVFNRPLDALDPSGLLLVVTGDTAAETAGLLALINGLCPAGAFVINNLGVVSSTVPRFCEWQTEFKRSKGCRSRSYTFLVHYTIAGRSTTPQSCTCICKAMQMPKTVRIIPSKLRVLAQPPGPVRPGAQTTFPKNGEIWVEQGTPRPAKNKDGTLVTMPAVIQLGHELCGHAVAGHGQNQGAIDIENGIRLEHGILDLRDGSDHNVPSWLWPWW